MRKLLFLLLFIPLGLQAQFFTPVTKEMLPREGERALKGSFFIRPEITAAGNIIRPVYVDGKFDSFEITFGSKVGFGASYALYKLVNDEPYNVYSFALLVSVGSVKEQPATGVLLTASAFDLYGLSPSVGLGYDFIKGRQAGECWYIMWGLNKTF